MMYRRYIYYMILIGGFLSSCSSRKEQKKENEEKKETPKKEVTLASFSPVKGLLFSTLQLPGELIAFQQVDIYAKVNSFVKKLTVDVGSQVKTGQLLAIMEAPEINSQLSGAESKLQALEAIYIASKANYDRLIETSKTPGTISPNDLDIANAKQKSDYAQLLSAKAAYKEIADNKNYLEIRAPFTGIISARNVSAGAYVGPSGKGSELPLFTLQEQNHLRLSIAVPEAYTGYLTNKSEVEFTVRSLPAQTFKATISRRAGPLDNRYRAERVVMDVINKDKKLLPGMVAVGTVLPSRPPRVKAAASSVRVFFMASVSPL